MLVECIDDSNIKWAVTKGSVYPVIKEYTNTYTIQTRTGAKGFLKDRFKVYNENKEDIKMSKYEKIATQIGKVVDSKNKQYGDAINNIDSILKILYPNGIKVEQYKDMSVMVRVLDKLFRLSKGDQGDESAWNDIAGYGILMSKEDK